MAERTRNRKRKAVTRDSQGSAEAAVYDELDNRPLELYDEEGDDSGSSAAGAYLSDREEGSSADEELDSVEVPSEDEGNLLTRKRSSPTNGTLANGESKHVEQQKPQEEGIDIEEEIDLRRLRPFRVEQDANGDDRYVYPDIEPVYDSDDSEAPPDKNTIGNIPPSFYEPYPHIGYDINGKKVMRPAKGAALDSLLDSIDIPEGWTGLTDPATGKPLELSTEELDVLRKVTRNEAPAEGYDPYPDTIEYFTSRTEHMPLSSAPEPKRRFVPSKHEYKRVMKLVKAIREGRIQPHKPPSEDQDEDEDQDVWRYDVWADEAPRPDHPMNMPAPKLPPPGYDESYHPPPEYLPDDAERKEWEALDDEDKSKEYLPTDHSALRKVPGYGQLIKEKFERCLDLYLAPRVRRTKLNINPESLLPKLPDPDDLRPFPNHLMSICRAHKGIVRSVSMHSSGEFFASGGDDGMVCVWDINTPYCIWRAHLSGSDAVTVVAWRPIPDVAILAATVAETIYLLTPDVPAASTPQHAKDILNAGFSADAATKSSPIKWVRPSPSLRTGGVHLSFSLSASVKSLTWHRHGNHFVSVSPAGGRSALAIHTLSSHLTQHPLRSLKGLPQHAAFHPSKSVLFVATQRSIRSYDLSRQELLKTLQPGARWISHFSVHPLGDNMVVSSYDKRLLWMDLDLSNTPYKTLRYHERAIRAAKFHGRLPLFADVSDDGSVQVFHGGVSAGLMENAKIVPLTVLRGHEVKGSLGVMDLEWGRGEAVLVTAGADGTCRVWGQ